MPLPPPPKEYLSTLLELRDYYAPLVEKYGKLYRQALDNLTHAEALLSNWPITWDVESNESSQEVDEEISTLVDQNNLNLDNSDNISEAEVKVVASSDTEVRGTNNSERENVSSSSEENISLLSEESEQVTPGLKKLSNSNNENIPETEDQFDESDASELPATNQEAIAGQENRDDSDNVLEPLSKLAKSNTTDLLITNNEEIENSATSPQESPVTPVNSTNEAQVSKSLHGQEIPMLSEYQPLRRIDAIHELLQKHTGSTCHIDFVVRSLYGELEPDAWKVVKDRVQSTLTHGKQSGKWSLVPGKPGYYTIDLKLLNNSRKGNSSKSSQTKPQKPEPQAQTNSISLKGEFESKFLIDAISSLLQQNPRKVFDVDEIINNLYGKLESEQMQQVRPKVLKDLSRGYRTGRFSRVPQEKGLYIWDSKLLLD